MLTNPAAAAMTAAGWVAPSCRWFPADAKSFPALVYQVADSALCATEGAAAPATGQEGVWVSGVAPTWPGRLMRDGRLRPSPHLTAFSERETHGNQAGDTGISDAGGGQRA
jgi:hypothetical protein